jgi:hypothetical protein
MVMSTSSTHVPAHEIHPLTGQGAESVAARASQVKGLIRERRKISLRFRRTKDERDRAELEHIDQELAKHHIDIPAIQARVAMRKRRTREPVIHSEG